MSVQSIASFIVIDSTIIDISYDLIDAHFESDDHIYPDTNNLELALAEGTYHSYLSQGITLPDVI